MKTVFSNRMVAHVWAQQSQDEGRGSGGNFYFSGNTIYSYGSHFPIAKFYGANTVVMTTRGYSNSTSKHIGYVRNAIPSHCKIIRVHNIEDSAANFTNCESELITLARLFVKARSRKGTILHQIHELVANTNEFAKLAKSRRRVTAPDAESMQKIVDSYLRKHNAQIKRNNEKRKAVALAELAESKKKLAKWLRGGAIIWRFSNLPVRLRIKGDMLQSSHGAECPLKFGERAYKQAKRCKEANIGWQTNGKTIKLGHFEIDKVEADGTIIAGCHTIPFKETLRIAKKAGWVK